MSVRLKREAFTIYENTNERKGTLYSTIGTILLVAAILFAME